jgi:preprotein translocase subunit SecF
MTDPSGPAPAGAGPRHGALWRLFNGQSHIDFVGRSRLWLQVSVAALLLCAAGVAVRGLNLGLDFTGGTAFVVSGATAQFTTEDLRGALGELGIDEVTAQVVEGDEGRGAIVTTPALEEIGGQQDRAVVDRLAEVTGAPAGSIDVSAVGPRWGAQVSRQALRALVVFLVLVVAYITLRFELRMALAAVAALFHDVFFTVGIYALLGFQVSPASVIALLTILGYSLYDTVVVFDRVKEDTARLNPLSTVTYGEVANRALNEMLVRSLSTSVTALLPVGSLLVVGATLLGADTLQDLALALFVGMAAGTYSSIVVATPVLVWLKEREPRYAELRDKVLARRGAGRAG